MTRPKRYKRYSSEFKREAILRAAEEGTSELGFDVLLEGIAVHRAFDHPGRGQAVTAQSGDKGHGFPMAVGNGGNHPLAFATAPAQTRHFGVDPGFINEHDVADLPGMGQQPGLTLAPDRPRRLHIGAFLFTGVCGFF